MLLRTDTLRRIADGSVSLAFRRWRRPNVKAGGTLLTPVGELAIDAVDSVSLADIGERDARAAGFDDLAALRTELLKKETGSIYRIALRLAGPDPRTALREEVPHGVELAAITDRLARWPWAHAAMRVIEERPGVRAGDLATAAGMEKARFKANVRRLKGLGLTESLEVGYRLSPRGEAVLRHVERTGG